jgi:hypothetical protein
LAKELAKRKASKMSISIGTTHGNTWKSVKARYVATVCGVALAVSAAVATDAIRPEAKPVAGASSGIAAAANRTPDFNHYIFYVVGSERQRDALIESAMGDDFLTPHSKIVIINSLDEELRMAATQAELTELGHISQVTDLRNR